jgi:hypothetical protein
MRLDLTADAGPVPFTLTSPQMRLAWAKTGLFQSLTPDILAMVLDKEKTMPGPRQHMRAVVADINHLGAIMPELVEPLRYFQEHRDYYELSKYTVEFDHATWIRKPIWIWGKYKSCVASKGNLTIELMDEYKNVIVDAYVVAKIERNWDERVEEQYDRYVDEWRMANGVYSDDE